MSQRFTLTHLFLLTAAFAVVFGALAHPAFAQTGGSVGNFSCSGGHAVGSLYNADANCPKTMNFGNIFSYVVCHMEQLSSALLGNMFCGMITGLAPTVSEVLLLSVALFGLSFTIGLTQASAREFQVFLLKICFVWAFATQSDYIIGIGYTFFIDNIRDGVAIALTNAQMAMDPQGNPVPPTGSAVYAQLDSILGTFMHYATDYLGVNKDAPIDPASPNEGCKNAIFAVLAIMAVAFPPAFYLGLTLLGKLALTFLRAVFGYLYALVGIAFLLTLSPFFMSFFLFRVTRSLFEKWIGYLASFALQIIILFAFLSFILSINVSTITNSFTALVVRNQETKETSSFRMPWDYCTLCEFQSVVNTTPIDPSNSQSQNFLGKGKLECIKYRGTQDQYGFITYATPLTKDPSGFAKPIGLLDAATPKKNSPIQKEAQTSLVTFLCGGLLSLVILAYIVESLLGYVASLAQSLATGMGGYSAPQLGGGRSLSGRPSVSLPFEGNINDFSRGFDRGYHEKVNEAGQPDDGGSQRNTLDATTNAFKYGASNLVRGRVSDAAPQGENSGILNRTINWFVDPDEFKE